MKDVKKLFKNLKRKFAGGGLLLALCNVSLIGVGFSSWLIIVPYSTSIDLNVTVGDIKTGDLFSIAEVKTFTLGQDGLVENSTIVTETAIITKFIIDNSLASAISNPLNFSISLECTDVTFLNTYIGAVVPNTNPKETNPKITDANENVINTSSSITDNVLNSTISYTLVSTTGTTNLTAIYKVIDDGTINTYYENVPTFKFKIRINNI